MFEVKSCLNSKFLLIKDFLEEESVKRLQGQEPKLGDVQEDGVLQSSTTGE